MLVLMKFQVGQDCQISYKEIKTIIYDKTCKGLDKKVLFKGFYKDLCKGVNTRSRVF